MGLPWQPCTADVTLVLPYMVMMPLEKLDADLTQDAWVTSVAESWSIPPSHIFHSIGCNQKLPPDQLLH